MMALLITENFQGGLQGRGPGAAESGPDDFKRQCYTPGLMNISEKQLDVNISCRSQKPEARSQESEVRMWNIEYRIQKNIRVN